MMRSIAKIMRKTGLAQPKTIRVFVTHNQIGYTCRATFVYDPSRGVWRSKTASCWHLELKGSDIDHLLGEDVTLHFHNNSYIVSNKELECMFWRTRL